MTDEDVPLAVRYKKALEHLGNGEPSTAFEAEAILDGIRVEKGYLDEETLEDVQAMRNSSRQTILRLVEKGKETEAAYTKSISEQLYSSKYRFLYELIQNADDSNFFDAKTSNKLPHVHFQVTPATLVVDTNEDGFTRANIEAICATGKSSKKATASDNHIGEKGFGFKSVFSVADEVHVQSGLWNFRFKHKQGEDGLGMVTPLKASLETLPSDVVTRITLVLSDSSINAYERLLDAIAQIPETTILHLHNLRNIMVTKMSDGVSSTTSMTKSVPYGMTVSIRVQTKAAGEWENLHENKFYTFAGHLKSMPHDSRRRNRTDATVNLAFPIDAETQKPKISASGQHVFAYLPLYRLPVQFIIQSDFITSASRESLIECAWNEALRNGIAEAFCDAITTFATGNHPLRHLWLQYLPKDVMHNNFWQQLYPLIKSRLQDMPVLQTWQGGLFKSPVKLRRLPPDFIHEGSPLFRDTLDDIYLAQNYDHSRNGLLADLGVLVLCYADEISRIEADLVRSDSRLKSRTTLNTWHQACARFLLNTLEQQGSMDTIHHRIRRLAIIPINNGRSWTGAPGVSPGGVDKIYFPKTGAVEIPKNIGLNLVHVPAATMPLRKDLFRKLGVQECPKDEVLSRIQKAHENRSFGYARPIQDVLEELQYLFHHHPHPEFLSSWILIPLSTSKVVRASDARPLYFLSAKEYDTQNLLPSSFIEKYQPNGVANFVSQKLSGFSESRTNSQGYLWKDWLRLATGAFYHPRLVSYPGLFRRCIPKTMLAVLEHKPEKFVGMLKAHWNEYKKEFHFVVDELQSLEVPCTFGSSHKLRECYLPSDEIMSKRQSLLAEGCIPIVKLPSPWIQETRHEWGFLGDLGVASTVDLKFYITIHRRETWRQQDWDKASTNPRDILIAMYTGLTGLATANDYENLRRELNDFIGHISDGKPRFTQIKNYVWEGPNFLTLKIPLKQHYGHIPLLENFFKVALSIPDYSLMDVIEELKLGNLNASSLTRKQWEEMYRFLNDNVRSDGDWTWMRNAFKEHKLVWGPDRKMYALQDCLWMSPFPLAGYVELSEVYPDLENFFVKQLGVEKANPSMLIEEIKKMAKERSPQVHVIQKRLIDIGRLVLKSGIDDTLSEAIAGLGNVKFLPKSMEDGTKTLVGKHDDFAINDHHRFGDAFKSRHVLLDFSFEEVHILSTLFGHLELSDRYLSQMVREESAVGEDAVKHETLTKAFRSRAYAMYCCAAQYKSPKALRNDVLLFNHLSDAQLYVTDSISTDLVLDFADGPISVHSNRLAAHHELCNRQLKFYLPKDERRRKSCYRSQIPQVLASIMSVTLNATQAISQILSCDLLEMDEILSEQDIAAVDWILKPTYNIPASPIVRPNDWNDSPTSPVGHVQEAIEPETLTPSSSTTAVSRASTVGSNYHREQSLTTLHPSTSRPPLYERFVEEVVQSAFRATNRQRPPSPHSVAPRDAPNDDLPALEFDHEETFGSRSADERAHDSRIGASGEAYVFETLSALDLPGFSKENWRSNMRRELLAQPRYANLGSWNGRETADFVYTDHDGSLTQYLREHCVGSMPNSIARDHDFSRRPIEYFLEVKSTTSGCNTKFYMSGSQFERMQKCAVSVFTPPEKVYVILRVFNLGPNTDMKIFVDPRPRELGTNHIKFEVGTYHCTTRDPPQAASAQLFQYSF